MRILVTGANGFVGRWLTAELKSSGHAVLGTDSNVHGRHHVDVTQRQELVELLRAETPDAIVHLAAIVGFPACQAVGKQVAWRYNVEATKSVCGQADDLGVERFVFSSTYSNYGLSSEGGPVTEESPLHPQSLYAETKIASEEFLLTQKNASCAPLIFRFATLYGISPRTRFDLIVNQFVLEAFTKRELIIYQRGYSRSFVHIRDAVRGVMMGLGAERSKICWEVFNLGTGHGNYSKDDIVRLVLKRMPETVVEYKDLTFGGDMRDITVSFAKVKNVLGFDTTLDVDDGIRELLFALKTGIIRNPNDEKYRNAQFIVQ